VPPDKIIEGSLMALGRGRIEICTDRELPMPDVERIRAGRFQFAVHRANGGDWPAAIIVALPHEFTQSLDSGATGVLNDVSNTEEVLARLEAVTSGRRNG
jgi:hypothetical protein